MDGGANGGGCAYDCGCVNGGGCAFDGGCVNGGGGALDGGWVSALFGWLRRMVAECKGFGC